MLSLSTSDARDAAARAREAGPLPAAVLLHRDVAFVRGERFAEGETRRRVPVRFGDHSATR